MSSQLDELLATISGGIGDTLRAVEDHALTRYLDFFEAGPTVDGETPLVPKTVSLPVPAADGSYQLRKIPIVALVNHNSLQIDELKLKFRLELDEAASQDGPVKILARLAPMRSYAAPASRAGRTGRARRTPADSFAEVEVHFKRGEASEGIARLAAHYHKLLDRTARHRRKRRCPSTESENRSG
ncbi:DUF2589 domain-containing protein [Nannocystis pusilla]|uniref:DUF2589 domain-containing protein n=1 Tax=Nannocystis pusilla TaxID=889268 RepID=A0A9X3J4J3_9BACT|nr:DUF2589 domain-containing protein [Nannocystis pusilla]MCY1013934.1 DUF2589 domain-containing protein [Nannocystis pusilla]